MASQGASGKNRVRNTQYIPIHSNPADITQKARLPPGSGTFIIRRMIKNWLTGVAVSIVAHGCQYREEPPSGYQGVVEFEERRLAFEFSGRLLSVHVDEGDHVDAGKLIAVMDDSLEKAQEAVRSHEAEALKRQAELVSASARPAELGAAAAKVRAARANEERIERNLTRERELLQAGATPKALVDDLEQELERARAERQALEQNLSLLKQGARKEEVRSATARAEAGVASYDALAERLRHYELKALAPGQVLEVYLEPGEFAAAGAPVVGLADTRRPYVDVFVPQAEASGVFVGQKMNITVDALRVKLGGQVEHIAPKTEFSPRFLFSPEERPNLVVRVRVRVNDPKQQLRAGVPAFATTAEPRTVARHD